MRVVEFAGIGPGPFACMLLADMGAEVVRIDRPGSPLPGPRDLINRGRKTVLLDLKSETDRAQVMRLLACADALVEGFRPGVMERLGLGPDAVLSMNPMLVYGRMTGWGQDGPLAQVAGHDINQIAIAGVLAAIGSNGGAPAVPLNLVGDYGGGSLYLVMGMLAARLAALRTGKGQVVDAAICDGALSLMSVFQTMAQKGTFREERGTNVLDGAAPYYTTYETSDGQWVAIGPIEPKFFALLCEKLDVAPDLRDAQNDRSRWSALRGEFAAIFAKRSRQQWCELLEDLDVCFSPVLTLSEAATHRHFQVRGNFVEMEGVRHIAPAPRFLDTPAGIHASEATSVPDVLEQWTEPRTGAEE